MKKTPEEMLLSKKIPNIPFVAKDSLVEVMKEYAEQEVKELMMEVEKSRWISVEDNLPEEDVCVLIFTKHKVTDIGRLMSEEAIAEWAEDGIFYDKKTFDSDNWNCPCEDVTHWMPLPEPPKTITP